MQAVKVKTAALVEDPSNARKHDQRNIKAIKKSLESFGQQKPIVVDEDMTVIAGNGTLEAACELGWEEIFVVVTKLSEHEKTAYAIADNRTAELADWDKQTLAQLYDDIPPDLAESTGFSVEELTALVESVNPVAPEDFPEVDEDITTDKVCPKCGFRWS